MSGRSSTSVTPSHDGGGPEDAAIARIVRAAERARAAGRPTPQNVKEIRSLLTAVAVKAGVPYRPKPVPATRKPAAKPAAAAAPAKKPEPAAKPAPQAPWSITDVPPPETPDYEIVRELAHSGTSAVYLARRTADGATASPKYAIKALQPPGIWLPDEARQRTREFLAAAALQKRVAATAAAAHKSPAWAPIHGEPAEIPGGKGAYYVTDRFVRSAEDLANTRREAIAEEDLWWLVSGVIDGLEQLQTTADRPHGNLKAGNVMLARRKNRFRVALADPHPSDEAARKLGRGADLHALGDMIRKLVLRDTGGTDAATASLLGAPTAWSHLGPGAPLWRDFCGALLEGGQKFPTFDDLRRAIKPLRPANRNRTRNLAVAATIAVLAVGSTAWALWPKTYRPDDWRTLCSQWEWYDRAHAAMAGYATPGADKKLDEQLALLLPGPKEIANISGTFSDLAAKADNPPQTVASQDGIKKTRKALEAIAALHNRMAPGAWPFWGEVDQHVTRIAPREPHLADSLKSYAQASKQWVEEEKGLPPDGFAVLLQLDKQRDGHSPLADLERVNDHVAQVEAAGGAGDAFLAGVLARIRAELDVAQPQLETVGNMTVYLQADDQFAGAILAGLGAEPATRFDWKRIAAEVDPAHPLARGQTTAQLRQSVDGWLQDVAQYAIVPATSDPRKAATWDAKLALPTLAKRIADARKEPGANADWLAKLDALDATLKQLDEGNRQFVGRTFVVKEQPELQATAQRLTIDTAALVGSLQNIEAHVRVDPKVWLPRIAAQPKLDGLASAAVNDYWLKQKNALLAAHPSPTGDEFVKLYNDIDQSLTKSAHALDALLAPPLAIDGEAQFDWVAPFRTFEKGYRERLLQQLCAKALAISPPRGDLTDAFLNTEAKATQRTWIGWQQSLATWVTTGMRLESLLGPQGGLYAVDETPPGDKQTLGDALTRWLAQPRSNDGDLAPAWSDNACKAAVTKLATEYARLADLTAPKPDAAKVRELLGSKVDAEAWSAFWAAGRLDASDWLPLKDDAKSRPDEVNARAAAIKLATSVTDAARRTTLVDRVQAEGRRRWMLRVKPPAPENAAAPATQPSDRWAAQYALVHDALRTQGDFEVPDADLQKDPKARYNLRLVQLIDDSRSLGGATTTAAEKVANARARELWNAFLQHAQSDHLAAGDEAEVHPLVAKLVEAEKAATDPKKVNAPVTVPLTQNGRGWVKRPNPGGESDEDVLTFQRDLQSDGGKGPVLQFARVDPPSMPAAFVLRSTVTLSQFNAVLPSSGIQIDRLRAVAPGTSDFGEWDLPDGATLLRARPFWVAATPIMRGMNPPPAAVKFGKLETDASSNPQPADNLPVQSVSPVNAAQWAASLGLRLPSIREWQAAVEAEQLAGGGQRLWNLRDAAWKADDDYRVNQLVNAKVALEEQFNPRAWRRFGSSRDDAGNVWDKSLTKAVDGHAPDAYNDGALLFLPAEPNKDYGDRFGRKFFHLIGNVWQIVVDDSAAQPAAAAAAAAAKPATFFVVGGSALSAPELGYAQARKLLSNAAFNDVGFRVAFEAPEQPPRSRLLAALRDNTQFLHD